MNIEQKHADALSAVINLTISADDYSPRVKKSLQEFRRTAEIRGFRKGMVPMGLIEKMHGRTALLEEVNKLISEGVNNYINENKIQILGEPLPSEDEQKPIDWENDTEFSFAFDLMLAPEVSLNLTKEDHIPLKQPKIAAKDKAEYTESLQRQFGQLQDVEAAEEEDFLKVNLKQGETEITDAYISLKVIEKKTLKKPFMGLKVGNSVKVDVLKTFPNETDRAALLKMKKEELAAVDANPQWEVSVLEVKRFALTELGQGLYDQVFGPDQVHNEEEWNKKIEERMRQEFAGESDYRFMLDARNYAIEKSQIPLADNLLKRWLHYSNDGKFSMEEIERDYEAFSRDLRWQMVREYLMKTHGLEVKEEDMQAHAVKVAQYQFSSYGLNNVPMEHLEKYAQSLLANEKEARRIFEKVEDDKVIDWIRCNVSLDKEAVPYSQIREINK